MCEENSRPYRADVPSFLFTFLRLRDADADASDPIIVDENNTRCLECSLNTHQCRDVVCNAAFGISTRRIVAVRTPDRFDRYRGMGGKRG
jgi:predicted molibdopterin-dependent oxidoreductase YjgC